MGSPQWGWFYLHIWRNQCNSKSRGDSGWCNNRAHWIPWQWGLTRVEDRFGNAITYNYQPELKDDYPENNIACYNHVHLIPDSILYGSFKIKFETEDRNDFNQSWKRAASKTLYTRQRLARVDLYVSDVIVKSYLLSYASDSETENVIYSGFKWQDNYRTSTLISVQEVQNSLSSPVEGYEPVTFSYFDGEDTGSEDYMHLLEVNNGYGGKVQFMYAPRYHADDINKDIRTARWAFHEVCDGSNNLLDWSPHGNTRIQCNSSGPSMQLQYYQNNDRQAIHVFPEQLLKPGARLIFWHQARLYNSNHSPTSDFGFRSIAYPDNEELIKKATISGLNTQSWVHGEEHLRIPASYNIKDITLFIENKGALIREVQVQQFITRLSSRRESKRYDHRKSAT